MPGMNKPKIGAPRIESERQERTNIAISKRLKTVARKIGNGNVSQGIRIALDAYHSREK